MFVRTFQISQGIWATQCCLPDHSQGNKDEAEWGADTSREDGDEIRAGGGAEIRTLC